MASSSEHSVIIRIVDQATNAIQGIGKSIDGMLGKIDKHSEGIAAIGTTAGIAFAGLSAGVASSVSTFANFEEKMSGVKAVLNPTTEQMEQLTIQAEKLGASTKFSALETSEATEVLAKNGLNATQILDGALESTLALASATGTDIATAADIATDAMASFNLETKDLSQVMNSITGVTNASKFSIEEYKYALAAGGGVASALGVELEDFNAVIAATSSRFAGGSDAGTSFKTFMQKLVPQTKEATRAMQELGLATEDGKSVFYDASGQLKSMAEISELLKNATKDLSEEQKNQYLSTIFGSDALRTAAGLAEVGAEKFGELQKSIEGTNAAENAKIRMDNLKGTFEELGGAVDSVKIALGRSLAPTIKQITIWVTELAQKIGVWAAENPQLASTIITIATAVTGLIAGASGLALVLGPIISGIKLVGIVLGALISPIGLVVAAIAAFGIAYSTNFLGFKDIVNSSVGWIWQKLQQFGQWLSAMWDTYGAPLVDKAQAIWEDISGIFTTKMEQISQVIDTVLSVIVAIWNQYGDQIMYVVDYIWNQIQVVVQTVMNIVSAIINGTLEVINGLINVFGGILTGDWSRIWEGIKQVLSGILGTFIGITSAVWDGIIGALKNFGKVIADTWSAIWNGIVDFIRNVFNGNLFSAVGETFSNLGQKALDWGRNMIQMFIDGIKQKWEDLKATVAGLASTVKDFLGFSSPTKEGPASKSDKWMPNFVNMMVDGIEANKGNLKNAVNSLAGAFSGVEGASLNVNHNFNNGLQTANLGGNSAPIPQRNDEKSTQIVINMGGVTVNNEADENRLVEKVQKALTEKAKLFKLGIG